MTVHSHISSIAVIGAGVAGLACARRLQSQGRTVTVFDRGYRPGGRLSVRRIALGDGSITYADHGAPFFGCTDDSFRPHLQTWIDEGICAVWNTKQHVWSNDELAPDGTQEAIFVGMPNARSIPRYLSESLDIVGGTTVTGMHRIPAGWVLCTESQEKVMLTSEPFDAVVMAAPPQQTARVFGEHSKKISSKIGNIKALPCWVHTVLVSTADLEIPDVLRVSGDDLIELVVHENAKPGRPRDDQSSLLVVYARAEWSASMYDSEPEAVGRAITNRLLMFLRSITSRSVELSEFSPVGAHRWGLARTLLPLSSRCATDKESRLVACGDAYGGSGLEAAFLSGYAAAAAVHSLHC
tara:strand:+ start:215339 stop:216397 length:1059 start_codon:yes stop_codon:yes gene_type:complete